jgi:1-deoxy-D-xylulose-5-phosphate synthase
MKKRKVREFDLSKPLDPNLIKTLNDDELGDLVEAIRKEIINKCSIYGGHLGSNLGVVELMTALFSYYNFPKDKLILDVGHQSYAQKILSGRTLDHLREENGVDGFQKKEESEYDCYEAGHSSTSISAAMGMALARDLKGEDYEVIALIGDSSIANGLAFEALNNLNDFHHRLIVILNDNEMSITEPIGGFNHLLQKVRVSKKYLTSKSKFKNSLSRNRFTRTIYRVLSSIKRKFAHHLFYTNVFEDMGIFYLGVIEGTDIYSIKKALKKTKGINEPILIHICTAKGKGYSLAEEDRNGKWHSVKPFNVETGLPKVPCDKTKTTWTHLYSDLLEKAMEEDNKVVSINPATRAGADLSRIMEKFPNRYVDVGIAEEHAIVFANGIANNGCHPYVTMYSTFLQRAYDELLHDVSRMNLPVTLLIDHCGLVGGDGETHQGIFDVSFMIDMPNFTIAMADSFKNAIRLFSFSKTYTSPLAIRYPLGGISKEDFNQKLPPLKFGEWEIIKESTNKDLAVISYGPKIHDIVKFDGDFTLYNAIFLSNYDKKYLDELNEYKKIIIYDPYGVYQGFAGHLAFDIRVSGYRNDIEVIALKNEFIKKGTIAQQEVREHVDLDTLKKAIERN